MLIKCVEIQNFRKLKSVRIELTDTTTLFVGANNSGKTSAMVALGHFLVDPARFNANDFTLSNLFHLDKIGTTWASAVGTQATPSLSLEDWAPHLPSMDTWLEVADDEIHYVRHLLPTLNWTGGLIGIRLRLEPKNIKALHDEFVAATLAAKQIAASAASEGQPSSVKLWPRNMADFLGRRLSRLFTIKGYTLDPEKLDLTSKAGATSPQVLPPESEPVEGNPFKGLIRIDEIGAQRGFNDSSYRRGQSDEMGEGSASRSARRLTDQLRAYYAKHIDPTDFPEPSDLEALAAIESAQEVFDERLRVGFAPALKEVEGLGYPGIADPRLTIATKLRPVDGLNHSAAVQYEISHAPISPANILRLPEDYNGLGYQNLISMIFRLMGFRDAWMQVGKAGKPTATVDDEQYSPQPLHLVLVEEPEAHLHAQVQQVFIRKAYDVLRAHDDLGKSCGLRTQLLVSTHSSHVAHETDFGNVRYFRRMPADTPGDVPVATVINLGEVFGPGDETKRFVTRYLRAVHCDLFFADAAILVEGPAERILVPHFIRSHFPNLNQRYITILEIGGSHAHKLRPLIDHLGLLTLVITDIDSADQSIKATLPKRGAGFVSRNATLNTWIPGEQLLDSLLNLPDSKKLKQHDKFFGVRVSYQLPISVSFKGASPAEALASTFEDALVFQNLGLFATLNGDAEIKKFRDAISSSTTLDELGAKMFDILKTASKARFALDVLLMQEPDKLEVPTYIAEGLRWLETSLQHQELKPALTPPAATP